MDTTTETDPQATLPAPLLTVADVSRVLRVTDEYTRRLIHLGLIPASRIGCGLRIKAQDLDAFLAAHPATGPDERRDPRRHGKVPSGRPRQRRRA